jgi:hypothetical protein
MFISTFPEARIASRDITVVIQGPLYRNHEDGDLALQCIASIRRHLPDADILISTWHHQNTAGLDADRIILSEEPPGFTDTNGNTNNILRQMVSTRRGIEAATRPYVLKFRADHMLINADFAVLREYPENFPAGKRLFKQPVTVTNYFIRNPLEVPMLFHISDLVQFGRREDMLDLWAVDLPRQSEIYLPDMPTFRLLGHFVGHTSLAQVPEQTLMLRWLKKHGYEINLPHTCYTSYALFRLWEQLLLDHFLVMNWHRAGIIFPKRFHFSFYTKNANYTEQDLETARRSLSGPFYRLRYARLLLNKYVSCWFNKAYLRSVASVLLFSLSPSLARRLRAFYRSRRLPRHLRKKSGV